MPISPNCTAAASISASWSKPEPFEGLIYEQPAAEECVPLPRTFDAAIEALDGDTLIKQAMGEELVSTFLTIPLAGLEELRRRATS